jgi:hypothetical protein
MDTGQGYRNSLSVRDWVCQDGDESAQIQGTDENAREGNVGLVGRKEYYPSAEVEFE